MNTNGECPIWGTPAKVTSNGCDGVNVDSPRAGGKYFISGTVESKVKACSEPEKVQLTDWLIEQRGLGTKQPEITSKSVKESKQRRPKPILDRSREILRYLGGRSEKLGSAVIYSDSLSKSEHNCPAYIRFLELLAYGRCIGGSELIFLLRDLDRDELIEFKPHADPVHANRHSCLLTVKGHSRLEELNSV